MAPDDGRNQEKNSAALPFRDNLVIRKLRTYKSLAWWVQLEQ